MNSKLELVNVTADTLGKYRCTCFLAPDHPGNVAKDAWLKKRFKEGLKIKILYDGKKPAAFIEYIPGEYAWRAVDAKGYMFIHCVWVSSNKLKKQGNASLLVKECLKDAKEKNMLGAAVVASEGPFMAGPGLFKKNGFKQAAAAEPSYFLMAKQLKKGKLPKFNNWEKQLAKYKGWNILYTSQCAWVARSILELQPVLKKEKLKIKIKELETAKEAQNGPSVYGTFNLIKDGRLLADHYVSVRGFMNILKKELK